MCPIKVEVGSWLLPCRREQPTIAAKAIASTVPKDWHRLGYGSQEHKGGSQMQMSNAEVKGLR